ncbi:MAG: hypothetical protein QG652_494 [Pseudomonadota bacterium]|nr:hypothetical protein [Pseudomonadota bacterium]
MAATGLKRALIAYGFCFYPVFAFFASSRLCINSFDFEFFNKLSGQGRVGAS